MAWSIETERLQAAKILKRRGIKCLVSKPDSAESTVKVEVDRDPDYMRARVDTMREVEALFPSHVYLMWVYEVQMPPEHQLTAHPEVTVEAEKE